MSPIDGVTPSESAWQEEISTFFEELSEEEEEERHTLYNVIRRFINIRKYSRTSGRSLFGRGERRQ